MIGPGVTHTNESGPLNESTITTDVGTCARCNALADDECNREALRHGQWQTGFSGRCRFVHRTGACARFSDSPQLTDHVRDELIRREVLFQQAQKTGFDRNPEVAARAEAARQKILAQAQATWEIEIVRAYMQDFLKKNPVSDGQLKAMYNDMKAKGGSTQYKVRHILVKDEGQAKGIIAKLNKGASFGDLAKESIDADTRYNGGDLGWITSSKVVKPFADAVLHLHKGEYTRTPVRTGYGFHVIEVDDTRPLQVPSFEDMKPMLYQQAQAELVDRMVKDLRAKATIQ
ncbi:peptidyl-prolyl cis-trans isomerase C [Paraburkholderia youngii]|uniref:peptidylprolyl isomerase n=1 Tax=Paraburkholderia youngii TaxID=2782701 RepID=UPI003D1FD8C4